MPTQSPAVLEVYPAYVCRVDCTLELIYIHNDSQCGNVFICYFFNTYMRIMHIMQPHPLLHYLASPVCCEFEYIAQL